MTDDAKKVWAVLQVKASPPPAVPFVTPEGICIDSGIPIQNAEALVEELRTAEALLPLSDKELQALAGHRRLPGEYIIWVRDGNRHDHYRLISPVELRHALIAQRALAHRSLAEVLDWGDSPAVFTLWGQQYTPPREAYTYSFPAEDLEQARAMGPEWVAVDIVCRRMRTTPACACELLSQVKASNRKTAGAPALLAAEMQHQGFMHGGFELALPDQQATEGDLARQAIALALYREDRQQKLDYWNRVIDDLALRIKEIDVELERVRPDKRQPIPEAVRREVWRRDGGRCVECGSQLDLEFDHLIPASKGGSSTARNIRLLCGKCNRQKSDRV